MITDDLTNDGKNQTRWTATELLRYEFPEVRWTVEEILPEGMYFLVGPPKVGKSWLAMNLAKAVASGTCALEKLKVEQGAVLYLALEDTPRRLQQRLRLLLEDGDDLRNFTFDTTCETLANGGEKQIRDWLDANPSARLVVVDVFARITEQPTNEHGIYRQDYAMTVPLKRIADEYSITVLVVHHTRKQKHNDFVLTVSGTNGLAGAADGVLVLSRERNNATATLSVTGRDVEEGKIALDFEGSKGKWKVLGGSAGDYEHSEQRRMILVAVRERPGIGPKEIAEDTGLSYDSVKHLVRSMDPEQLNRRDGKYFPVHSDHLVHSQDKISERSEQSEQQTSTLSKEWGTSP